MKRKDFSIQSDFDGLAINVVVMYPDSDVRGIVQISHGMAEHKERYFEFMEYLTVAGFITVIHDHRGHGSSVKDSADLGYFYDTTGIAVVEDVHQITLKIRELYPQKNLILFGHSMGSLIVRSYIKKYDADIDKLIVCGSPSNNPFAGVALIITGMIEAFKGNRYRSSLLRNLAFGSYNEYVGEKDTENAWICAEKSIVEKYNADEFCGFTFTLNGFRNLFLLMKNVYNVRGWVLQNPSLPIFFIAGCDDPVILSEKSWNNAQNCLRKIGYVNVIGKLYDNMRHEILNEYNRLAVFSDILNWISE